MAKKKAALTRRQVDEIKQGFVEGASIVTLLRKAKKLGPATKAQVEEILAPDIAVREQKREAKKEGAELIEMFLKNTREGCDVDDMAALIEQALYRDILRRYMEQRDDIDNIGLNDLLKLDLSYRKIRLSREKKEIAGSEGKRMERWAATYTVQLFDKVIKLAGKKGSDIAPIKKELLAWAKERFSAESFDEAEKEQKEIDRLNEYLARKKNGADSKRAASKESANGFIG